MATAAKKTSVSYNEMSDAEKLAYFTEYESVPHNSRTIWIKEHHHTHPSAFYRDRNLWLKHHPDFQLSPVSLERKERVKKRLRTMRKQQAPKDDLKERQRAQAAHAREALAAKRATGETVRGRPPRLPIAVRMANRLPSPVPAADDTQSYLDEYLRLSAKGLKAVWLERHGLNFQKISEVKRLGRSLYSFSSFKPDPSPNTSAVRDSRSLNQIATYEATILPAPPRREATLDDAIAAFEVQRDQLSSFIEQLKRMRGPR